ncbi:MAG: ergothioneine biosynthesis protein EgtB [Bermanella sp.]|jgi:ergothioneine biosynthesis protein EgtB
MNSIQIKANYLLDYQAVRSKSTLLIANLSVEDCSLQASDFVSPAKWHLAHTTWFFETFILLPNLAGYKPYHPLFQTLFNSYYNAVGEQFTRSKRHVLSRPSLETVLAYRKHVDDAMAVLLETTSSKVDTLVLLGLNHEQQHQELLLMDLKYCFYQNPLYPSYFPTENDSYRSISQDIHIVPLQFISFKSTLTEIGTQFEKQSFCFDNETPQHQAYVQPYELANRLVTNGEFLQFIENGGYQDAGIWLSDGWAWLSEKDMQQHAPLYWVKKQGQWFEFGLDGLQPLNLYKPVTHVNFYEAYAYAQWVDCRLPSEFEWEHAVKQQGEKFTQIKDQAWQWTQSAYQPYSGFKKPSGAVGEYNGKFMCNQMVLRGGCELTPENHARLTYRNFFYPQDQWPMTGIRLANDLTDS